MEKSGNLESWLEAAHCSGNPAKEEKMKILLVTFYEPDALGVRYLASSLLSHGHDVHILQMKNWVETAMDSLPESEPEWMFAALGKVYLCGPEINPITERERELFSAFVSEWRPDVVGLSIRVFKELAVPIAASVRSAHPEALLVCGGVSPTLDPEFFVNAGIDAVLRGEGEEAIVELANAVRNGEDWKALRNVSYMLDGRIAHNPVRPLVRNLDALPLPLDEARFFSCIEEDAHNMLPISLCSHITPPDKEREAPVITSRGCIGHCAYCSSETLRQVYRDVPGTPKMRFRSLANVMQELVEHKKSGATFIAFWDDFLIREPKALIAFFKEYKEIINVPFLAQLHPRQLERHPELLNAAVDAGIKLFYFGIQSGSPDFCKNVYQRDFADNVDYPRLFADIQSKNADSMIHFIGGNPLEERQYFEETLRFVASIPFDATFRTSSIFIDYYLKYVPGSPLLRAYPDLPGMPRSQEAWLRNALLIDIRHIAADDIFDPIYKQYGQTEQYREVMELRDMRHKLYDDAFHRFFMPEVDRLKGRNVYYWGCGDLYHKNKDFLRALNPKAILLDIPYSGPFHIDGIPVRHPLEVAGEPLPVVIFSGRPSYILRKIRSEYPVFPDVVPCPHIIGGLPEVSAGAHSAAP